MRYRVINTLLRLTKPIHIEYQDTDVLLSELPTEENTVCMPAPTEDELQENRQ